MKRDKFVGEFLSRNVQLQIGFRVTKCYSFSNEYNEFLNSRAQHFSTIEKENEIPYFYVIYSYSIYGETRED